MIKKFFLCIMLLLYTPIVNAANKCDIKTNNRLIKESANIKINYEEIEGKMVAEPGEIFADDPSVTELPYYYFRISLLNLTDDFYAVISEDKRNFKGTFRGDDTSTVSFDWKDITTVSKLKVDIYSSSKTKCPNTLIRTLYKTIPRYNPYSEYAVCKKVPKYNLCKKYVEVDEISYKSFSKGTEKEIKKLEQKEEKQKTENWFTKLKEFLAKNKIVVGIIIAVIVLVPIIIYVIKNKRVK